MATPTVYLEDGDETNGLGDMIAGVMNERLEDPARYKKIKNLNATAVIELTDMEVAVTLTFNNGEIRMKNGKVPNPDVYMGADYLTLADLCARKTGATMAMLKKKLVTKGSLGKLLKIQKVLLLEKE